MDGDLLKNRESSNITLVTVILNSSILIPDLLFNSR